MKPLYAQSLTEAITQAWIMAADHQVAALPPSIQDNLPPVPPTFPPVGLGDIFEGDDEPLVKLSGIDNAIENLQNRTVMRPDDFNALSAKAKAEAFTITTEQIDAATDEFRRGVQQALSEAAEQGPSFTNFKRTVMERFDTLPISKSHLEQVYRNNLNEAYAQGQERILDIPVVSGGMPYRAYFAISDGRVRDEHEAMETSGLNGTNIYHKDDPTWLRFRPPWDWGCRCGWVAMSIEDAAAAGVQEAKQWLLTGIEPVHFSVKPPSFSPDARWERREAITI